MVSSTGWIYSSLHQNDVAFDDPYAVNADKSNFELWKTQWFTVGATAKNPSSALLKLHFDYRTNYDHNDSLSKNVVFTSFTCCLEALCITFSSHCYFSILFHFCPFFWPSDLSQQLLSHANHANVTKLPSRSWAGLLFHTSCHSNITLEPFRVWHLGPCCIKVGL